jgi:hypothetical protein
MLGFGTPRLGFGQYQEHHVEDRDALAGHGRRYDLTIYGIVKVFNLIAGPAEKPPKLLCELDLTELARIREQKQRATRDHGEKHYSPRLDMTKHYVLPGKRSTGRAAFAQADSDHPVQNLGSLKPRAHRFAGAVRRSRPERAATGRGLSTRQLKPSARVVMALLQVLQDRPAARGLGQLVQEPIYLGGVQACRRRANPLGHPPAA